MTTLVSGLISPELDRMKSAEDFLDDAAACSGANILPKVIDGEHAGIRRHAQIFQVVHNDLRLGRVVLIIPARRSGQRINTDQHEGPSQIALKEILASRAFATIQSTVLGSSSGRQSPA